MSPEEAVRKIAAQYHEFEEKTGAPPASEVSDKFGGGRNSMFVPVPLMKEVAALVEKLDNRVTKEHALAALDSIDDYARMDVGVDAHGPKGVLKKFIEQEQPDAK